MEEMITIQVPSKWFVDVPQEELVLRQILHKGIYQYKVERALQLFQEGIGSLGYIAEKMNLSKQDLIREARMKNMEPEFSEETFLEELSE